MPSVTPSQSWPDALARVCEDPSIVDVAFQPIVDLARGTVAGYEALARFPAGPGNGPEAWFGAAARHGFADPFEAAVLTRTLAAREDAPPNCFVSINASPGSLESDEVQAVLAGAGSLAATVIEITEQRAVADYERLSALLDGLRGRGALVAVDDAGAGYASLSHVMRLRPDFVKLDRGLVSDCDRDEAKLAALEMLGQLVGRIDGWVVAEGIERREELDALLRIGIPLGQGYHLSRPGPQMGGLEPELLEALAERSRRRALVGGVSALVEPVTVVGSPEEIAPAAGDAWAPRFVVVVDAHGRPAGLMRAADGPGAPPAAIMAVTVADRPQEVALRAMTRTPEDRFDPVVCCDVRGRVLGIVPVERLVAALARV